MSELKYKDYLRRLAEYVEKQMSGILAEYNFDNGPEFEIAMCKTLRQILPKKYGICRGYVVAANVTAGDDIIIFDKERFPTLRFLNPDQYENKEYIPVEAVYAYIECKYTIHLNGDKRDGQSFLKACTQVASVKNIPREPTPNYRNLAPGWPEYVNPLFGAVFSRRVRKLKGAPLLVDAETVNNVIVVSYNQALSKRKPFYPSPSPDLLVIGDDILMLPQDPGADKILCRRSPFFIEGSSVLIPYKAPKRAFAIGLLELLFALDTIRLGRMPWPDLINEAIVDTQKEI